MININELFKEAYKTKSPQLQIITEIKARIQTYNGSKEAISKPYNDEVEIKLLGKLKKEHEETLSYMKADDENRGAETIAIRFLESVLPAPITDEEVIAFAKTLVTAGDKSGMRHIGTIAKQFPGYDGAKIRNIVMSIIA